MHKIVKIVLIVVGLIGAVLWFMLPSSDMPAPEAAQSGALNSMFMITFLLLGVAIVFSLVFAIKNMISNPAGLKRTLFGVVGFVLAAIISYVMSSGTDVGEEFLAMSSETVVKRIGMGLNLFLILTVIAVVLTIVPSIKRLFGK